MALHRAKILLTGGGTMGIIGLAIVFRFVLKKLGIKQIVVRSL